MGVAPLQAFYLHMVQHKIQRSCILAPNGIRVRVHSAQANEDCERVRLRNYYNQRERGFRIVIICEWMRDRSR
jgi:hypothetical protein